MVAALLREYRRELHVDAYIARKVDGRVRFDPVAT
jgi:hypothetical protein